jgi:hypothetical protein
MIYPNYDITQLPVGYVELGDSVDIEMISECAIVPTSIIDTETREVKSIANFGMILRTAVDTRSREEKMK